LLPRSEPVLPARRLSNREFGALTLCRLLTVMSRQLCANQLAMNGALFVRPGRFILRRMGVPGHGECWFKLERRRDLVGFASALLSRRRGLRRWFVNDAFGRRRHNRCRQGCLIALLSRPRLPGVLVGVLGIAGGAARESDHVTNHRDNGVVRQAAFTRTVVVQNVTKPKLALLHQQTPDELAGGKGLRKATQS
jgi:hypothetical protein